MSNRKSNRNDTRSMDRELRGQQRDLERQQRDLQQEEKRLLALIKAKAQKEGKDACVPLVNQLMNVRNGMKRNTQLNAQLSVVNSQQRVAASSQNMAQTMGSVSKLMNKYNTNMDPAKMAKTLDEFNQNQLRMEMNEESMNDLLLDIDEDNEAEDEVLQKVLSELHIDVLDQLSGARQAKNPLPSASVVQNEDMEERLTRLRN